MQCNGGGDDLTVVFVDDDSVSDSDGDEHAVSVSDSDVEQ